MFGGWVKHIGHSFDYFYFLNIGVKGLTLLFCYGYLTYYFSIDFIIWGSYDIFTNWHQFDDYFTHNTTYDQQIYQATYVLFYI